MARSASFAQISMNLSGSLLHVLLDRAIGHGIGLRVLVRYLCGLSHGNQGRSVVFAADAQGSSLSRTRPPRSRLRSRASCVHRRRIAVAVILRLIRIQFTRTSAGRKCCRRTAGASHNRNLRLSWNWMIDRAREPVCNN